LMFTFEDLLKTDDRGIQNLLRDAEKDKLALALKGASDDLKALFFKNMSERASKIMQEDMQSMGPVRVKDVDDAQQAVITVAKKLIDDGPMVIAVEGGEDEFIS
jgi:flagellar motor switch protein FliG